MTHFYTVIFSTREFPHDLINDLNSLHEQFGQPNVLIDTNHTHHADITIHTKQITPTDAMLTVLQHCQKIDLLVYDVYSRPGRGPYTPDGNW